MTRVRRLDKMATWHQHVFLADIHSLLVVQRGSRGVALACGTRRPGHHFSFFFFTKMPCRGRCEGPGKNPTNFFLAMCWPGAMLAHIKKLAWGCFPGTHCLCFCVPPAMLAEKRLFVLCSRGGLGLRLKKTRLLACWQPGTKGFGPTTLLTEEGPVCDAR